MSAGLVDNYQPSMPFQQHPHRKPLPSGTNPRPQSIARYPAEQQQQQYLAGSHLPQQLQPGLRTSFSGPGRASTLTCASISPNSAISPTSTHTQVPQNQNQYMPTTKRTLSNATASTSSTGGTTKLNSSASSTLQRTTSARSNQPTSYVALLRKQKATVWCDRAQQEDPRVLAQQRAAKQRAAMEVSNINTAGRSSTSGSSSMIRSKMRHGGAPKAQQYTPNSHPASGVPMRLSAREVDEDDSDDDSGYNGRSSVGSGRLGSMRAGAQQHGSLAAPVSGSAGSSLHGASPVAAQSPVGSSARSAQSAEDEELNFGGVGHLPQRRRPSEDEAAREQDLADLRRRGSVDERTLTMSGYRKLFVANPDID